jgi:hypothetical protein
MLVATVYHRIDDTFIKVADVACWHLPIEDALEVAYIQTTDDDAPWCFHEGVIAEPGFHRSSREGDMVVIEGERYLLGADASQPVPLLSDAPAS